MSSRAEIGQILGMLGTAYARQALNQKQILRAVPLWHALLGDLEFELLQAAVQHHCANSQWFPSIAELRQAAFALLESDADRLTAGEAWREVKAAISIGRHHFQSGERCWSSPAVEKAFRAIGGWSYFRHAPVSAETADRARFMQTFQEIQAREVREQRLPPQLQDYGRDAARLENGALPQLPEPDEALGAQVDQRLVQLTEQLSAGSRRSAKGRNGGRAAAGDEAILAPATGSGSGAFE